MKHDIAELLPFYANGTLDAADRARVETELATCTTCSEELRELETLAAALSARADAAPPLAEHVFDDAFARIATTPSALTATKLRTAWWGTPARYATAAVLVVSLGAAGFAAWHVREADVERNTRGTASSGHDEMATVFRVTPGPAADVVNPNIAATRRRPEAITAKAETAAAPAVAKPHRLAKNARIELLVRDVEGALKRAESTVRASGGDVTALSDSSPRTADAVHDAQLTVEVPAPRLDATLDALAGLGAVQNRAIDAEDVDAAIVDEEARLRNLRREEIDLRALMDKGGKIDDILSVQQNLSDVRGQIEQLDAQHQHDVHRVATSTITIKLSEDRPNSAPAKPGPTARIDGAWHSGVNALADTVVSFLSTIAWCVAYAPVPLALSGAAYAATRLVKRRPASA